MATTGGVRSSCFEAANDNSHVGKRTRQTTLSFTSTGQLSIGAQKDGGGTPSIVPNVSTKKSRTGEVAVEEPSAPSEERQETPMESLGTPQETQVSSQEPGPSSTSLPSTEPHHSELSSMDDQEDVSATSDGQQDDQIDQSSVPLEEFVGHPIGNRAPKFDCHDRIYKLWQDANAFTSSKPIQHCFTETLLRRIGARWRLAVYTHNSIEEQQRAVLSVPWHELDYRESTPEQKQHYHRYCDKGVDSHCQFQAHVAAELRPEDFVRTTALTPGTNETEEWFQGAYAGMDTFVPQAFAELEYKFRDLSSDELMKRCSRQRTTNANESIHQKLALLCHKCISHTTDRIRFGASSLQMVQNFGYLKSSLLNVFGWMTERSKAGLAAKDELSVKSATRKHRLEPGTTHHHRRKVAVTRVGLLGGTRTGIRGGSVNVRGTRGRGRNEGASTSGVNVRGASGRGRNEGASTSGVNVRVARGRGRNEGASTSGVNVRDARGRGRNEGASTSGVNVRVTRGSAYPGRGRGD